VRWRRGRGGRTHQELVDRSACPWDKQDRRASHADKRKALQRQMLRAETLQALGEGPDGAVFSSCSIACSGGCPDTGFLGLRTLEIKTVSYGTRKRIGESTVKLLGHLIRDP
jgi:hypothetical protein